MPKEGAFHSLRHPRLSRSSDLTQGRKGERDEKVEGDTLAIPTYGGLPLATTENIRTSQTYTAKTLLKYHFNIAVNHCNIQVIQCAIATVPHNYKNSVST